MLACIVDLLDLIDVNDAASVCVKFAKCRLDQIPPELIHGPTYPAEELVVVDLATSVSVEGGVYLSGLCLGHFNPEVMARLDEFIDVKRSRVVVVGDTKLTC